MPRYRNCGTVGGASSERLNGVASRVTARVCSPFLRNNDGSHCGRVAENAIQRNVKGNAGHVRAAKREAVLDKISRTDAP